MKKNIPTTELTAHIKSQHMLSVLRKWALLPLLFVSLFIVSESAKAQVIVETFENNAYASAAGTYTRGGTYASTSSNQTISTQSAGAATITTTTQANTQASLTSMTWGFSGATTTSTATNGWHLHSVTRGIDITDNGGYLVTPIISGGITTVTFYMANTSGASATMRVGLKTNTAGTASTFLPTTAQFNSLTTSLTGGAFFQYSVATSGYTQTDGFPGTGTRYTFSITGTNSTAANQVIFVSTGAGGGGHVILDDIVINATQPPPVVPLVLASDVTGSFVGQTLNTIRPTFKQYRALAASSAGTGVREWQFTIGTAGTPDYTTNWRPYTAGNTMSVNTYIPIGFANGARYNSGSGGVKGLLPAITSGSYYTFNVSLLGTNQDQTMQLLETTFNPATISTVAVATGANAGTYGAQNVSITMSGTPASGENVFVRYSTDAFVTSTIVQASFTGATGIATIPFSTSAISYYAYSSNKSLASINSDVTTYGQSAHDMATLNVNTNGGANYTVAAPGAIVVISSTGSAAGVPTSYATFTTTTTGLFAVLNGGAVHTGTVTALITADITTEPGNTTGTTGVLSTSAAWTSLGIRPNGARTVSGAAGTGAGASLFTFNGADAVTIDGLNTGGNSLIIANTQVVAGSNANSTIRFDNDAANNTVQNCTIQGQCQGSSSSNPTAGIIYFGTSGGGAGNIGNTISGNTITGQGGTPAIAAIFSLGTSAAKPNTVTVNNNTITDILTVTGSRNSAAIWLSTAGNEAWSITNNRIYKATSTTPGSSTSFKGINILTGNGHTVNKNFIGFNGYINLTGASSSGTTVTVSSTTGLAAGQFIMITSGTGVLANSTTIQSVTNGTTFVLSAAPTTPLSAASIAIPTGTFTINGTATTYTMVGINLDVLTTTAAEVQGNVISGISMVTTSSSASGSGVFSGIYVVAGKVNIGQTAPNIIGSATLTGAISVTVNSSSPQTNGIAATSTSSVNISNNIIGGITALGGAAGNIHNFYGIQTAGTAGIFTISGNTIGSTVTANSITNGTSGTTTAAQTVTGILNAATGVTIIGGTGTGNIIQNLTNFSSSTTATTIGISNAGQAAGTLTITENSIISLRATGGPLTCITNTAAPATLNLNSNILRNHTMSGTVATNTFTGILNGGAATTAININNNALGNATGGLVNFTGVSAGTVTGISALTTAAGATLSISTNDFRGITYTSTGTGAHNYITYSHAGSVTDNINTNTFTNLSVATTGDVIFIARAGSMTSSGIENCNGNNIVTAFNKTQAGGTVTLYYAFASSVASSQMNNTSNNFSNITVTGATIVAGWQNTEGPGGSSGGPVKTITGNTFSNWTCGSGAVTGIQADYSGSGTSVSTNTFSTITGTSTITGILLGANNTTIAAATHNCSSNIINTLTSSGGGGAVVAISSLAITPLTVTFGSNALNTLSSTAASVNAISIAAGGTSRVSRNRIYDLSSSVAGALVYAVNITGGTTNNIYNNLIGDLKATAGSLGATPSVAGLFLNGGTTNNAYNNTIWMTGTGGTNFGTAAVYASTTPTTLLINNLLVNLCTPGGTGKTVAYQRSSTTSSTHSTSSNGNSFYSGDATFSTASKPLFFDGTNSDLTLAALKSRLSTAEAISLAQNPTFASTTGSSGTFLHITAGTATALESGGVNNPASALYLIDFDNDNRPGPTGSVNGGASSYDIGADEFDGIPVDAIAPSISYTALTNTCTAGVRTLLTVISDAGTGVPTSGTGLPRAFFKINAGAYTAVTGVFVTGSTYSFNIGTGSVGGDVVSYYIVAQDLAGTPNVTAFPLAGAAGFSATPPAASTPPTTPSAYTVNYTLNGTYNVGAGGTFTTLTAAVAAYNAGCNITGPVVFNLTDASYASETYPITINSNAGASAANTLTIKPTQSATTFSGSSATALIVVNGADYVTIDGSTSSTVNAVCPATTASRNITFTNSNSSTASAVIWLQTAGADGATNNVVKNCNLVGNSNITTFVGVGSGSSTISAATTGTGNVNDSFINNNISKTQYGIVSQGASAVNKNTGTYIGQNLINTASTNNVQSVGIYAGFENGIVVTGNNIGNLQSVTTATDGIAIALGSNAVTTSTFTGNEVINATVTNNVIGAIRGITTYSSVGIYISTTTNTGTTLIANNMMSGVLSNATSGDIVAGIFLGNVVGTVNVFYNSITLVGTVSGGNYPSFGLAATSSATVLNIRNNIFLSTASTGANLNRAMGFAFNTYTNLTSNNNDLFVSGTGAAAVQVVNLTNTGATSYTNVLGAGSWNAASTKDANSVSASPTFISGTDLHLNTSNSTNITNLYATGAAVSVTTDIDCDSRGLTPDIGADEFAQTNINVWSGRNSTSWTTASNWKANSIPTSTSNVTIPTGATFMPLLQGATTIVNLVLQSATTLGLNAQTFTLNGTFTGPGTLTGGNTSSLVIGGTALNQTPLFTSGGTNNFLQNFTVNTGATATLGNALNITASNGSGVEGVLTVNGTLATGGFLTLKSTTAGTARVAQGATGGGYITGNATVERFIPQNANKSWRLLASNTTGSQTINAAWQEGQTGWNANTTGFGAMISRPGASAAAVAGWGYDTVSNGGFSLLKYNPTADDMDTVHSTLTTALSSEHGYFLFVRGDRRLYTFDAIGSVTGPVSHTILRSNGGLFQGNQLAVSTGAQDWALVRNPYVSRIDMRQIVRGGNLVDAFQVWDSKYGGLHGVGGYQTFTKSGSDYVVFPGTGSYGAPNSVNNFIESGAAFFIQSVGGGSAQVVEAAKTSGSSLNSFRPATPLAGEQKLIFSLYAIYPSSTDNVDGGAAFFANGYNAEVDVQDVRKSPNFTENFGLRRNGVNLVVERRPLIGQYDTLFFNMNNLHQMDYRIDLEALEIDPLITTAFLDDKFLGTSTALDLTIVNSYTFTVTSVAASRAADRFRIVFRSSVVVPVTFTGLKAQQVSNNIAVEWKVANQLNIVSYEIMKSTDGRNFSSVATQPARNINSGNVTYNWLDENATTGANYYRIKSVDRNGQVKYTDIVKVVIGKGAPSISVSPNPILGNHMQVQFVNQPAGKYGIRLFNTAGQLMYVNVAQHAGGSASQSFDLPLKVVRGVYQLEINGPDNKKQVQKLIINPAN